MRYVPAAGRARAPARVRTRGMRGRTGAIDVVFLDVGGTLFDDSHYFDALLTTIRELGGAVGEEEFAREYRRLRQEPTGSFRSEISRRFLGEDVDMEVLGKRMRRHWHYPSGALMPGSLEALRTLAERHVLGILADQEEEIRRALHRDGVEPFIDVWCISSEVGLEKPDPALFRVALERAGVEDASRAVMVGDRLDEDIRPAHDAGMRAILVLTGKAPPEPTPEQLAEPDAWIRSMHDLPEAVEGLTGGT